MQKDKVFLLYCLETTKESRLVKYGIDPASHTHQTSKLYYMPTVTLKPVRYIPSTPLSGDESMSIYRGQNAKLRGTYPNLIYEAYPSSLNLNEPIPALALTGTLSFTEGGTTVTGTGTDFLDELHIGQKMLCANGEVLAVERIISATSFINARPLQSTAVNTTASRTPRLFPLDIYRGSQIWGNAIIFDRGTISSVGDGVLYRNGAVLQGDSLTASRRAQIAIYDSVTGDFDVQPLGFDGADIPIAPTVTIIGSGGSKNMSLGYYSFRVAYYSDTTTGYGNPTETILAAANAPFQLTAANSRWSVDFTADVANRPSDADGYIVYQSAFAGSSAISQVNAIQGGWFEATRVKFTDLVAEVLVYEAVDSDLLTLVSFDNDAPPDAEFITTLDNYTVLISTNGQGVGTDVARETTTSPGAFISPQKADNNEGFPASLKVPTEKGEVILGFVSVAGRIFVMTSNTLQAVSSTGLPSAPMVCRPFWKRGFTSPDNLVGVGDTLYGFTTSGFFRSIATGDKGNEESLFASDVETETADWFGGYVLGAHDPKNDEVCFCYSASRKNEQGYWESDILPYSLRQGGVYQPKIVLSSPTRDMIVTGAATVNGHFEFIAGGRREGTTDQYDTWQYDMGSNEDVDGYLAWSFQDSGIELISKNIRKIRAKGKFADADIKVYITTADAEINIEDLENGTNAAYSFDLPASTGITQYAIQKCRVRNALMWTVRLGFTSNWDGTGKVDQIHEIVLDLDVSGAKR